MIEYKIAKAGIDQMPEVAQVFRASRLNALPFLPELHTQAEDLDYFTKIVFPENEVYVALQSQSENVVGFIAFTKEWVSHLYLLPEAQARGLGGRLLALAKAHADALRLWTFQKNLAAISFYKKHGFIEVERTDGSKNEEKEPDILLRWKNEELKVRAENTDDVSSITAVHNLAFGGMGESRLVTLIRASGAFVPELSLVAELNGSIVAHVLFSKIVLTERGRDLNCLSLAPLAVIPELQKRGLGQKLVREGKRRAQAMGFSSILVLGDTAYYGRFGFQHKLAEKISCRYSCKDFQGLELVAGSLENLEEASATYPAAFLAVD